MARRTLAAMADLIEDMVDKPRADTTFDNFCQDMLVVTLQEIISQVPHARWLLEEFSITATAATQFVAVPTDFDPEGVISLRDNTNNRQTVRISPDEADLIDPGRDLTGDVLFWWFQRVGGADRLYFLPRPDAADSLSLICGEVITDPTSAQTTALPAKYEWVWLHGALIKVWERLDPEHDTSIHQNLYKSGMDVILRDANKAPGASDSLAYHRPRHESGIRGPSFPADYDILP